MYIAALENVISGVTDGTEFLICSDLWDTVRDAIRSFQSVFWLLPSALVFGNDTVFVRVGSDQYTANDFEALFQCINFPNGYAMYTSVASLVDGWSAPNVPTFCYYGLQGNNSTPVGFTYDAQNFPDSAPTTHFMGNSDGTVNQKISVSGGMWNRVLILSLTLLLPATWVSFLMKACLLLSVKL